MAAKTLVILESPAKAKKVQGFLGPEYIVKASVGHVRDIPIPKEMTPTQKAKYGDFGIDMASPTFEALYKNSGDKSKVIKELKEALGKSSQLILLTDADAEGNAIAWHLMEILQPKVPTFRATTLEITKSGIDKALKTMVPVDHKKREPASMYGPAESALTRGSWDRIYGYSTSPLLWKLLKPGTSSGRVQSPGARLVVERELKRLAFKSVNYYSVTGDFEGTPATLVTVQGKKIAQSAHIDDEGKVKEGYVLLTDENIDKVLAFLKKKTYEVGEVKSKPYRRTPPPPFTTSAALQSIGGRLGMSAKQLTSILQHLYASEGSITYIRTVSVVAAPEAIAAARKTLRRLYGPAYVSPQPRVYRDKSADNSGHEAIRPVLDGKGELLNKSFPEKRTQQVFDAVHHRMLASQSIDCEGTTWSATFVSTDGQASFAASETLIHEPGWTKVYAADDEASDG